MSDAITIILSYVFFIVIFVHHTPPPSYITHNTEEVKYFYRSFVVVFLGGRGYTFLVLYKLSIIFIIQCYS